MYKCILISNLAKKTEDYSLILFRNASPISTKALPKLMKRISNAIVHHI